VNKGALEETVSEIIKIRNGQPICWLDLTALEGATMLTPYFQRQYYYLLSHHLIFIAKFLSINATKYI